MEILEDEPACIGPAVALNHKEISTIIKLGIIGKSDIFYDLGSGHGHVVFTIVREAKVRKAVGIEINYKRFCRSVSEAKKGLTREECARTELYCANYFNYNFSDATVIYEGHDRNCDEVKEFEKTLGSNHTRIIVVDLPFVGYRPIDSISYKNRKFFLMQYPVKRYKISCANEWASHALSTKNATIADVYGYYEDILRERGFTKKEQKLAVRELSQVVQQSFSKRN